MLRKRPQRGQVVRKFIRARVADTCRLQLGQITAGDPGALPRLVDMVRRHKVHSRYHTGTPPGAKIVIVVTFTSIPSRPEK